MESQKKNRKVYIIVGVLCLLVLVLGGYLVYDKVLTKKEKTTNSNSNNTNQNSNKVSIKDYAGIYEAIIVLSEEDPEDILKGFFELKISEDNSCGFGYSVTRGSGWRYEGRCEVNNSEVILKSTRFSFDAEEELKNEEIKFTINKDGSLSYTNEYGTTILKKSIAKNAFDSFTKKYNLKITSDNFDPESFSDEFLYGVSADGDDYALDMYKLDSDESAKTYFQNQKNYHKEANKEQKILSSESKNNYDIYEATLTPDIEEAPAATGEEVEYILQARVDNYVIILFQSSKQSDKTKYINLGTELKELLNIK